VSDLARPVADVRLRGNVSAPLDDPDRAWIVTAGRVLVFATGAPSDATVGSALTTPGARHLVLEAGEGDLPG